MSIMTHLVYILRRCSLASVTACIVAVLAVPFVAGVAFAGNHPAGAQVANAAASLSYGFPTQDAELVVGMAAASINGSTPDSSQQPPLVERASSDQADRYIGIVTSIKPMAARPGVSEVFVTQSGQTEAYATDLNGEVQKGDSLALSPLRGVLMKASDATRTVVGTAQSDFNVAAGERVEIATGQNGAQTARIGSVSINVNLQTRPEITGNAFLINLGSAIAGKPVSQGRVIAAAFILALLLVIEGAIIYSAVHSSVTAIGRNPLARGAIFKELINVSLLILLVMTAGLGVAYLVVWF